MWRLGTTSFGRMRVCLYQYHRHRGVGMSSISPGATLRFAPQTEASNAVTTKRPPGVNIYGGTLAQRENVARRLAQLPEWHAKLEYESLAICLLTDGLFHESVTTEASTYNEQSVGRASSSSTASSEALAEAFLKSDLQGTIMTIFHVASNEKKQLQKAHGMEVLRSWAKDTLRQHLASMGSVGATGLILEPVLMDLTEHNSDEAHEDDAMLAKALTQKVSLKTTALPGTLIPAKHCSKLVLLVFPRRETRPSEGLHRGTFIPLSPFSSFPSPSKSCTSFLPQNAHHRFIELFSCSSPFSIPFALPLVERLLLDYCRKNLICLQTYYLALDCAYSADVAVRDAEAKRYQTVVAALPKGSLILGEEAALDVLVGWTEQARLHETLLRPLPREKEDEIIQHAPVSLDVDISTFYMSLINFFYGPPTDVLAGNHRLENLGPQDLILVTDDGHHPYDEGGYSGGATRGMIERTRSSSSSSGRGSTGGSAGGKAAISGGPSIMAALRGERLAERLRPRLEKRFGPGQAPQVVCGDLEKQDLSLYSLVLIHSGNHPIEPNIYKKRLDLCKNAGVAVTTPSQLKTWLRRPSTLATVLKVWPRSFKARVLGVGEEEGEEEERAKTDVALAVAKGRPNGGGSCAGDGSVIDAGEGSARVRKVRLAALSNSSGAVADMAKPAAGPWEHGFRKTVGNICGECDSWSCGQCTRKQQEYGERLGKSHQHGLGLEWRDLY